MALYARANKPELDATKVPNDIDVGWAAGIYEGEGSCRNAGHGTRGFMVCIVQKDPELLYWIRDWFGGSVKGPNTNGVHGLNICGDRGRLFIAQIYSRLTARRRQQVDATGCLEFLEGRPAAGLNFVQLKAILDGYYDKYFVEKRARYKRDAHEHYVELRKDPQQVLKHRENGRLQRETMTPEQKEASRIYQQQYYQNKRKEVLVLLPEKTA